MPEKTKLPEQAGYLVRDLATGHEFVAVPGEYPICLVVHPLDIFDEDDTRTLTVVTVKDAEAGTEGFEMKMPTHHSKDELEIWAAAVRVATTIMAHTDGEVDGGSES